MRLFRQAERADWSKTIGAVTDALRRDAAAQAA